MQPRLTLTQIFSTFAQFEANHFSFWATSSSLRRNFHQTETEVAAKPEAFWVWYWYQKSQSQDRLATGHLTAYVQEACYWAAYRIAPGSGICELPDRFQIAIATLPKVLEAYRPDQGASLKTYALLSFSNTIRDRLRQQQESSRRTEWGLLRKVSQKCLMEALEAAGLTEEMVDRYRLVWTGFKRLYQPSTTATRQLVAPDAQTWRAIADFYYHQRAESIEPATVENWLKVCARQIRAYLSPSVASLNLQRFEDGTGEMQDDLPDPAESPMEALVAQEEVQSRQQQKMQVGEVLANALEKLDPQMQTLLRLYYQQTLTQQQIAQQLDMKQYTVSRRLSSAKEALLKAIVRWSQDTLHISLTSPAVQQMSLVLEEWLQTHYQKGGEDDANV